MLLLSPGWLPRTQVGKQEPLNGPFEQLALICLGQKVNWSTALDMGTLGERFPLMPKGPVGGLARPRNLSPRERLGAGLQPSAWWALISSEKDVIISKRLQSSWRLLLAPGKGTSHGRGRAARDREDREQGQVAKAFPPCAASSRPLQTAPPSISMKY